MAHEVSTANRLAECEKQIADALERGRQAFLHIGVVLKVVHDEMLYRQTHTTFEAYCFERWGIRKSQAYRLIAGADVLEILSPMGDTPGESNTLPTSERQVRPLTRLPADERADAWKEAVDTAPNGKVTGAHVEEVVDRRQPKPEAEEEPEPEDDPIEALTQEIRALERRNAELEDLNESLNKSDLGREVTAWSAKYAQLNARLEQALKTGSEAKKQAEYQGKLLSKIRKLLGVERNGDILDVIRELAP